MYGFQAQRDALPESGAHPLIVFSHGSGGRMTQIAWMTTALAEQGYIVAGVNHHGTTSRDSDPHQTVLTWMRPKDISAILDAFETGATDFTVDMQRVAASGFSFGGYTALAMASAQISKAQFIDYCTEFSGVLDCGWYQDAGVDFTSIDASLYKADFRDDRISATIAIDPALPRAMTETSLRAMEHPSLIINFGLRDEIPAGVRADSIAATIPNALYISVRDAWHFSGINACSWLGWAIIGASGLLSG
ncbi:alpha/beta hydrolase family protein, partial [Planktotalea sp.]|uniref:alpha/beta hydrolase family protein n=1 Tax=Planktotalea sp. TaxID=2029877 RepID=UPI0035C7B672